MVIFDHTFKLDFYRNSLLRLVFHQFPNLQALQQNQTDELCLSDDDPDCFASHLQAPKEDLGIIFKDHKELKIPERVDSNLDEELIDLQNNFEGKVLFLAKRAR